MKKLAEKYNFVYSPDLGTMHTSRLNLDATDTYKVLSVEGNVARVKYMGKSLTLTFFNFYEGDEYVASQLWEGHKEYFKDFYTALRMVRGVGGTHKEPIEAVMQRIEDSNFGLLDVLDYPANMRKP